MCLLLLRSLPLFAEFPKADISLQAFLVPPNALTLIMPPRVCKKETAGTGTKLRSLMQLLFTVIRQSWREADAQ